MKFSRRIDRRIHRRDRCASVLVRILPYIHKRSIEIDLFSCCALIAFKKYLILFLARSSQLIVFFKILLWTPCLWWTLTSILFWDHWFIPLFWISGDISSGFQSLILHYSGKHNVCSLRSTSFVTPADLLDDRLIANPVPHMFLLAEVRPPTELSRLANILFLVVLRKF